MPIDILWEFQERQKRQMMRYELNCRVVKSNCLCVDDIAKFWTSVNGVNNCLNNFMCLNNCFHRRTIRVIASLYVCDVVRFYCIHVTTMYWLFTIYYYVCRLMWLHGFCYLFNLGSFCRLSLVEI